MHKDLYDSLTNLNNFVDGLMYIDSSFTIVYHKQFHENEGKTPFHENETIGKKLTEVLLDYDTENGPLYRAVKFGEYTINSLQQLKFYTGVTLQALCTVMPVRKETPS